MSVMQSHESRLSMKHIMNFKLGYYCFDSMQYLMINRFICGLHDSIRVCDTFTWLKNINEIYHRHPIVNYLILFSAFLNDNYNVVAYMSVMQLILLVSSNEAPNDNEDYMWLSRWDPCLCCNDMNPAYQWNISFSSNHDIIALIPCST